MSKTIFTWLLIVATGFISACKEQPRSTNIRSDSGRTTTKDASVHDATPPDTATRAPDVGPADSGVTNNRKRKSIVLALDGVRPDALAHANTPNYDALINGNWQPDYRGAYTETARNLYGVATVSGPNHAAIMTGAESDQHGVTSNGNFSAGDFRTYRHYLRLLEDDDPSRNTAYLFTWGTDIFIPSGADYVLDDNDSGNTTRVENMLSGTHSDNSGAEGTRWEAGTDPDAIFLFLDDPDGAGHGAGYELGVSQYITAMETCDAQLGRILSAIANRPNFADEDWQIIMTSDHGGYHNSHGPDGGAEHTIPFLVASRHVTQGRLPVGTANIDVVPTLLDHMGVSIPSYIRGQVRGSTVEASPPAMIGQDLVRYYRFQGNLDDAASGVAAIMGVESNVDPTVHMMGGKFGGYVQINDFGGGSGNSSYLTISSGTDIEFGDNDNFTVTMWFRSHGTQSGDPVILGNKSWDSGQNAGWLILANEGANNSFGSNFASGSSASDRTDLEDIDYMDTDWWFLASVFDANGNVALYAGNENGGLRWITLKATSVGDLRSPLPLNLGQDGTGEYGDNLDGDIDDLAIWRRALNHDEITRLYAGGTGLELQSEL
jgi:hypothetical protein